MIQWRYFGYSLCVTLQTGFDFWVMNFGNVKIGNLFSVCCFILDILLMSIEAAITITTISQLNLVAGA